MLGTASLFRPPAFQALALQRGGFAFSPATAFLRDHVQRAWCTAPGALPSWDSRTRWNNLLGGLAVRRTVGPSGHANSPHPSSREGRHPTARWPSSAFYWIRCCMVFMLLLRSEISQCSSLLAHHL